MFQVSYIYIAILLTVIWAIYRIIVNKKSSEKNTLREVLINIFFIYLLILVNLTICKMGVLRIIFNMRVHINYIPFVETINMLKDNFMGIGNTLYNVIGNILLFVPIGFAVPLFFRNSNKLGSVALYGFIASFTIEFIQIFTPSNITDVDDIIFNILGSVLGFFIFNICYKIIKNSKCVNVIDKVSSDYKGGLVGLCVKPIGAMILSIIILSTMVAYSSTASGKLSDEEIVKAVFSYYDNYEIIASKNFDDYKFLLSEDEGRIELLTAEKVLNNRWTGGAGSQFDNTAFDYSVTTINNDNKTGLIVFGKNKDADTIEIEFNGNKYSEVIKKDDYFIVSFPTFELLDENSDVYNFFSGEESNDLKISFLENGNTYEYMIRG